MCAFQIGEAFLDDVASQIDFLDDVMSQIELTTN